MQCAKSDSVLYTSRAIGCMPSNMGRLNGYWRRIGNAHGEFTDRATAMVSVHYFGSESAMAFSVSRQSVVIPIERYRYFGCNVIKSRRDQDVIMKRWRKMGVNERIRYIQRNFRVLFQQIIIRCQESAVDVVLQQTFPCWMPSIAAKVHKMRTVKLPYAIILQEIERILPVSRDNGAMRPK